MVSQTPWLEHRHIFNNEVGLFPCLYERFVGTPARIEELVKGVHENILVKKPNNKWSVKEHIGHLIDLENLHEKRLEEYVQGKNVLTGADMSNKTTEDANYNEVLVEKLVTEFRQKRMEFATKLKNANDNLLSRIALHPRLQKPMQLVDMIYFVCEHDDHHLAKMRGMVNY